jgi:NodT family efflux transporter outer membrane factor (OMF) lipoprotein
MVPLNAVSASQTSTAPLAVNHQGQFPSVTVSFNLAPGVALGQATDEITAMERKIGMPETIHGMFSGTLEAFADSLSSQPMLIVTAILAVYIVLGMLYESTIHPLTILSTLPSAGVGAALILMLFHIELSVVALIGIILLIGIVKKNAILMIDFAIAAERGESASPRDAIYEACLMRFRPILMTTMAALFGALPLAFGRGMGAELRRPLGITIIGGLVFSQILTLYTTPVVYLALDRLGARIRGRWGGTGKSALSTTAGVLVIFIAAGASLGLSGCASVGPKYERPPVETPAKYKELGSEFKPAHPQDAVARGKWWEMYHDPKLGALEAQVSVGNQNIAASYAAFLQARALIKGAKALYYPNASLGPSVTSQGGQSVAATTSSSSSSSSSLSTSGTSGSFTQYSLPMDASWVPDLWGRIGSMVRQDVANAQVSAADLENERLLQQAELAIDYFELREQDALIDVYRDSVNAYRKALELSQALSETGIDSDEAVAQAETQLETTEAIATSLAIARAQYEHAIAMLIGKPAGSFTLEPEKTNLAPPEIANELATGVPSQLLERRPDIAAAERAMAAANAQIGIGLAAYYPSFTLTGSAGFGANSYSGLLSAPAFLWSLGASFAETIFDGGARAATVEQYRAFYDQAVATYRQTVLAAFQGVEDDLAGLRILSEQSDQQARAIASARRYLKIALSRYQLGIDPYLDVLSAQQTLLTNQQTAISVRVQQLTTSVQLIEALGGGWDTSQAPDVAK